jgi:hypothetical protein
MPATSLKQKKFMDAVAHNPAFAKKAGVPVKVAKEFSTASTGQKFSTGGHMATKNNGITTAKMGSVKTAAPSRDGMAVKGKTKGKQVVMSGSKSLGMKNGGMTKKMNYGGKC